MVLAGWHGWHDACNYISLIIYGISPGFAQWFIMAGYIHKILCRSKSDYMTFHGIFKNTWLTIASDVRGVSGLTMCYMAWGNCLLPCEGRGCAFVKFITY